MNTWHIHIQGRVQGVGFRPFVYRIAKEQDLVGNVANTANGVHIYINGTKKARDAFILAMEQGKPPAADIISIRVSHVSTKRFSEFEIIESHNGTKPKLLITPDIGVCSDCREELHENRDRRYGYAFTTCTQCGPRYSVMKKLPYDRETTTMAPFKMCPTCKREYNSVANRRFYSQTNSCPSCGINLRWLVNGSIHDNPVEHAGQLIKSGKIVAVKGIGGFLLLADATNTRVIEELRRRKNRPKKPFALLFKDVNQIESFARISHKEQKLLESARAPIVLLTLRRNGHNLAVDSVAPKLNRIGAMLPYAPILDLLAQDVNVPIVATSANVSGSPIVYRDSEAERLLTNIADAILTNDRKITFPQDDSVMTVSKKHQHPILLRRSRGAAPSLNIDENILPNDVVAFGGEMKSAFGFTSLGNTYLSQYLGDTSSYESQESYNYVFTNLMTLLKPKIKTVAVDAHPDYHTSVIGKAWAKYHECELKEVQHHRAHFGAILAEHDLIDQPKPVLGVIWDGTGYGDDGNIWGGEFFVYEKGIIRNGPKLGYYPHILNDRMSTHPPVATLAAMWPLDPGKVWMRRHFTEKEQEMIPQVLDKTRLQTSSIGRLFDATAALLEICPKNNYEGEAAILLQQLAEKSKKQTWEPYCLPIENKCLSPRDVLENIKTDKKAGVSIEDLALKFHQTLVQWIAWVAATEQINHIAFSGGVFQNSLLVDMIIDRMEAYHDLYFHDLLPPNDENIAIGQMAMTKILIDNEDKRSKSRQKDLICA